MASIAERRHKGNRNCLTPNAASSLQFVRYSHRHHLGLSCQRTITAMTTGGAYKRRFSNGQAGCEGSL